MSTMTIRQLIPAQNCDALCARIVTNLDNCTNQDNRDAYTYPDLEIKATPESADIKDYLQPKLLTITRTSGCLEFHAYVKVNREG